MSSLSRSATRMLRAKGPGRAQFDGPAVGLFPRPGNECRGCERPPLDPSPGRRSSALKLQAANPHEAVTFVSVANSGASIPVGVLGPMPSIGDPNDQLQGEIPERLPR